MKRYIFNDFNLLHSFALLTHTYTNFEIVTEEKNKIKETGNIIINAVHVLIMIMEDSNFSVMQIYNRNHCSLAYNQIFVFE